MRRELEAAIRARVENEIELAKGNRSRELARIYE